MNFCYILVLAFSVTQAAILQTWIGLEKKEFPKKHDSHCYERTFDIGEMQMGEVEEVLEMCITATCLENGNVKYSGCPLIKINPPCEVFSGDMTKSYPDCCFKIKCPEESEPEEKAETED